MSKLTIIRKTLKTVAMKLRTGSVLNFIATVVAYPHLPKVTRPINFYLIFVVNFTSVVNKNLPHPFLGVFGKRSSR